MPAFIVCALRRVGFDFEVPALSFVVTHEIREKRRKCKLTSTVSTRTQLGAQPIIRSEKFFIGGAVLWGAPHLLGGPLVLFCGAPGHLEGAFWGSSGGHRGGGTGGARVKNAFIDPYDIAARSTGLISNGTLLALKSLLAKFPWKWLLNLWHQ